VKDLAVRQPSFWPSLISSPGLLQQLLGLAASKRAVLPRNHRRPAARRVGPNTFVGEPGRGTVSSSFSSSGRWRGPSATMSELSGTASACAPIGWPYITVLLGPLEIERVGPRASRTPRVLELVAAGVDEPALPTRRQLIRQGFRA